MLESSLLEGFIIEGYELKERVAEGGFGVIFRAEHKDKGREVALKILKPPADRNEEALVAFREAFRREALLLARIRHSSLVEIFDVGETNLSIGRCSWMALEWLDGQTLRQDLLPRRRSGGRTPAEAVALLRPVIDALALLHEEDIAHRDLKPANIVLARTRNGIIPTVIDLGIARPMEEGAQAGTGNTQTLSSLHAFSLTYAAPEQVAGTRTGPWTDVHALGLILTELLTDLPPYPGKERQHVMLRVMSELRPTPAAFGWDVGPLQAVLEKATALKAADRYPNAGTLLDAIDQALAQGCPHQFTNAPTLAKNWDSAMEQPDADAFGQFMTDMDRTEFTRILGESQPIEPMEAPKSIAPPKKKTLVKPVERTRVWFVSLVLALSAITIALAVQIIMNEHPVAAAPVVPAPVVPAPVLAPTTPAPPPPRVPVVLPLIVQLPASTDVSVPSEDASSAAETPGNTRPVRRTPTQPPNARVPTARESSGRSHHSRRRDHPPEPVAEVPLE